MRYLALAALVLLGNIWLAGAWVVQESEYITIGQTIEAHLEQGERATWLLTGDTPVHVDIDAYSTEFDTHLQIFNEDGERLRYNDDWHETKDAHVGLAIEPDKTYTIVVSSYENTGSGLYQLSVKETRIQVGQRARGRMWQGQPVAWLIEQVNTPTTVNIDVTSEDFDTLLSVFDQAGNKIAENDDRPGDTDSLLTGVLLAPDEQYTIVVSSYQALQQGDFVLSVFATDDASSAESGETTGDSATTILTTPVETTLSPGSTVTGSIQPGDSASWTIVVEEPVTVTFDLHSDEFDPFIELYDAGENRIRYNDDRQEGESDSRLAGVPLAAGQPYKVVVRSYNNQAQGTYQLSAETARIGPDEKVTAMLRYEPVRWHIEVAAHTVVKIDLHSEAFDTQLTVYDQQGNQIAFNDDWQGDLNSHVEEVELWPGETYIIEAVSVDNQGAGSYTLAVEAMHIDPQPDLTPDGEIVQTLDAGHRVSWRFRVDQAGPITFDLRSDTFDAVLTVKDAAGNEVARSDSWGGTSNARITTGVALLPNERYTLLVSSYDDKGNGEYRLSAAYTPEATHAAERWMNQGLELMASNDYRVALERFARAETFYRDAGDSYGKEQAAFLLGLMNQKIGHHLPALEAYGRALELQWQTYGNRGEGQTLEQVGQVYYTQGEYITALDQYWLAWDIASKQVKDRQWTGRILYHVGEAYHALRQYEEAITHYAEALHIAQDTDDQAAEGDALSGLGRLYQEQHNYELALDYLLPALEIRRVLHDRTGEGTMMQTIAWAYMGRWQYRTALEYFKQALAIHRNVNSHTEEARALEGIGNIHRYTGEYELAIIRLKQAQALYIELDDLSGAARALDGVGYVHYILGHYADALSYLDQALNNQTTIGDRRGELTSLNYKGAVYTAQGHYSDAFDLHDRAYLIAREMGDRHGMADSLYFTGEVFRALGQPIRALDLYWDALEIQREVEVNDQEGERATLFGIGWALYETQDARALSFIKQVSNNAAEMEDRRGVGLGLVYVGEMQVAYGEYEDALESYRRAESILREANDRRGLAIARSDTGWTYAKLREYDRALDNLFAALVIHHEVADIVWEARTLERIGAVYDERGEFGSALKHYQQALNIGKQTGELKTQIALLNRIGAVYYHMTEYDKALINHQQARDIALQINDLPGLAESYALLGNVYREQGQTAEAETLYQLAQEIYEQLDDRVQEGHIKTQAAELYQPGAGQPWQYGWALHLYFETWNIHREMGNKLGEAIALNKIGVVYRLQGKYQDAEVYHKQALEIVQQADDRLEEVRILQNLGALYEEMGHPYQALPHYERAIELIEAIHADIGLQSGQMTFGARKISILPYHRLVGLLIETDPTRAFLYAERGRARTFLFYLENLQLGAESLTFENVSDADLLNQLQAKRDEILALETERTKLFYKRPKADEEEVGKIDKEIAALGKQIDQLEIELAQIGDFIEAQNPDLNQLTRVDVPDIATIQTALADDTLLLSYYVTENEVYAFVLTQTDIHGMQLPATPGDLRNAVSAFRVDQTQTYPLEELYTLLIEPLEGLLKLPAVSSEETPKIIVVPHDVLNFISFASLTPDGESYLIDQYAITYSPSAAVYTVLVGNRPEVTGQPLVLGDPDYSLPYAMDEARAVAAALGVQPALGNEATESLLREHIGTASIVHIAAHGKFDAQDPLSSALKLAGDDQHDGYLEVREVYGLPLREHNPLVVLSACETAVGALTAGDEFQGLTRAFLLSGARTVVASLWTVNDAATSELMTRFYKNQAAGMSEAEALATAQRTLRQHRDWSAPDYWAGFVLMGVPD